MPSLRILVTFTCYSCLAFVCLSFTCYSCHSFVCLSWSTVPSSGDAILLGGRQGEVDGHSVPESNATVSTLAGAGVRIKYGFVKVYPPLGPM
jgi:hypothetical protein